MPSSISVPVPTERQEELRKQYYEAFGHALSTWMQVEGWMTEVFVAIYDDKHLIPLRYTFSGIQSVDSKLKTITRALRSPRALPPKEEEKFQQDWKELKKKLSDLNSFRNKLAHGILTNRGTENGLFIYLNPFPWENDIPIIDDARRKREKGETPKFQVPPPSAIALEEIIEFQRRLAGMYREVMGFAQRAYERRVFEA